MSVPAGTLLGMKIELGDIDTDILEDIIGTGCYDAALAYVRRRAVSQQMWAGAHNALFGVVLGSHGDYYTPAIYFSPGPPLEVLRVHCGCAARHGCEHAAALLLSALEGGAEAAAGRPAIPRQARRSPAWDASLEAWLSVRPAGPAAAGDDAGHRADPGVRARPARGGAGEPADCAWWPAWSSRASTAAGSPAR